MPSIADIVAASVRQQRERLGWTQEELGRQMAEHGYPWKRITVAEIEGMRRRSVSLEELVGLLSVFGISLGRFLDPGPLDSDVRFTRRFRLGFADLVSLLERGQIRDDAELRALEASEAELRVRLAEAHASARAHETAFAQATREVSFAEHMLEDVRAQIARRKGRPDAKS